MKRFFLLTAFLLAAVTGMSAKARDLPSKPKNGIQDTIIIKLPNGSGITVYVKDTKQLKSFSKYKLDSLMELLGTYVEKVEKMEKDNNGKETKEVTVTFNPGKDSKDPNAPQQITVTLSAGTIEKIRKENKDDIGDLVKVIVDYKKEGAKDSTKIAQKSQKKAEKRARNESYIDLGLNSFGDVPLNSGDKFDLRPLGSRYVAIGHYKMGRIGGKSSPLFIRGGLEGAFNNFMFDKNNLIIDNNGVTDIIKEPETGRSLEKSKLTYSTFNIPVQMHLQFKDKKGKDSFTMSAGGFGGYRLGAHSKIKYQEKGKTNKDKERSSYNLEDFQYGATFSIGYRDLELFGKYNLNNLFKENRGPEMQTISFGFRL